VVGSCAIERTATGALSEPNEVGPCIEGHGTRPTGYSRKLAWRATGNGALKNGTALFRQPVEFVTIYSQLSRCAIQYGNSVSGTKPSFHPGERNADDRIPSGVAPSEVSAYGAIP
jgi:hypothetical protein